MWTTRAATRDDQAALVALCHAAVGQDDYVPDFLDRFLETGVVFLAEESGRAVGMMVYHDVPDGSAWLHAARTHPDWRRQGVATALTSLAEGLARQRDRSALRLWAEADNEASVTANRKYGYLERARFTRMRVAAAPSPDAPRLEPLRLDRGTRSALESSLVLRKAAGYIFHDMYFLPLGPNVERLAKEGALQRFGPNAISISEDYEEVWGRDLQIQPLFGDLGTILRACPSIAAARGADRVESFLPHDALFMQTARQAGFSLMGWGQEAILFEKRLAT